MIYSVSLSLKNKKQNPQNSYIIPITFTPLQKNKYFPESLYLQVKAPKIKIATAIRLLETIKTPAGYEYHDPKSLRWVKNSIKAKVVNSDIIQYIPTSNDKL